MTQPRDAAALLAAARELLGGEQLEAWPRRAADLAALGLALERLGRRYAVAVVGEFSSGKSFLLNALLGTLSRTGERIGGLLAVDINPSTATITEIEYGAEPEATAYFASGRSERVPIDSLSRFVAVAADRGALHEALADDDAGPTRVAVQVDSPLLRRGFLLADTPGLASLNPAHRRATLNYLPRADAVLYLIDTQQPFTEGDAAFLGLVAEYVRVIFIVQTKIDLRRERGTGGKEAWENAFDRIRARAAQSVPGAEVVPVSARDYAAGVLDGDSALRESSNVPGLIERLDHTLETRVRAAREGQARELITYLLDQAHRRTALERELLECDRADLLERNARAADTFSAQDAALIREHRDIAEQGRRCAAIVAERGTHLRESLGRALARALDTADIARVRDRAKLHMLVDGIASQTFGAFAGDVAAAAGADFERLAHARPDLGIRSLVARGLGGEAGSGAWSRDLGSGIRATIVLSGIGGPVIPFVEAIAREFAAAPSGTYMKRELTIDLRDRILPDLERGVDAFTAGLSERMTALYAAAAQTIEEQRSTLRSEVLAPTERALERDAAFDRAAGEARLDERLRRIDLLREEVRRAQSDAPAVTVAPRADGVPEAAAFDSEAYVSGLHPERFRVVLLGGLDRGKSALINAFAGAQLLNDQGSVEELFPIHVRYGKERRAYALTGEGTWHEIATGAALAVSAGSPVLIETPWNLPRQLVLVHAPAFDSGEPNAETIALSAAAAASEVVMLFSRQLSDREVAVLERVADLKKPLILAHTMADVETAKDRRTVVELAERALRSRGIPHGRIFTVSAHDALEAALAGRAASGWNELGALRETLAAQAQEHMQRLELRAKEPDPVPSTRRPEPKGDGLLDRSLARLFGRPKGR